MLRGSSLSDDDDLGRVIDQLAHLLPAQGPISIFIHHNTLHAFEHLPFEEAVETAAEQLECEPFLSESRYRDKLASGRILAKDVTALLDEQLGARGATDVAGAGHMVAGDRNDIFGSAVIDFLSRAVPVGGEPVPPPRPAAPHHEGPAGE